MSKHYTAAAALLLLIATSASAEDLKPVQAQYIDLGRLTGVAYYTVYPDGFHVVTTLAANEADASPLRVQTVLAAGQSVVLSMPSCVSGARRTIRIAREGDAIVVKGDDAAN
jgi:hypothetical protein